MDCVTVGVETYIGLHLRRLLSIHVKTPVSKSTRPDYLYTFTVSIGVARASLPRPVSHHGCPRSGEEE
jgi:hypothetical protein